MFIWQPCCAHSKQNNLFSDVIKVFTPPPNVESRTSPHLPPPQSFIAMRQVTRYEKTAQKGSKNEAWIRNKTGEINFASGRDLSFQRSPHNSTPLSLR
jgi:hypothetical protein